jgi:hypothetical protein
MTNPLETQLAQKMYSYLNMNSAVLDSKLLSKKREKASHRSPKVAKQAKHEDVFSREAFDKALDESLDDILAGRLHEVDMKVPEKSIRKIIHQAK